MLQQNEEIHGIHLTRWSPFRESAVPLSPDELAGLAEWANDRNQTPEKLIAELIRNSLMKGQTGVNDG